MRHPVHKLEVAVCGNACICSLAFPPQGSSWGGCFNAMSFIQKVLLLERASQGFLSSHSGTSSGNISKKLETTFKHPLITSCLYTWRLPLKSPCVHGYLVFTMCSSSCPTQGVEIFHLVVHLLYQSVSNSKPETLFFPFHQKRTQMLVHLSTRVSVTFGVKPLEVNLFEPLFEFAMACHYFSHQRLLYLFAKCVLFSFSFFLPFLSFLSC